MEGKEVENITPLELKEILLELHYTMDMAESGEKIICEVILPDLRKAEIKLSITVKNSENENRTN